MIPIRDTNPSSGFPLVNYAVIGSCVLVFLYELSLGQQLQAFLLQYGLVPARYTQRDLAVHFSGIGHIVPFFSSMFLHGGWLHLIGNMWTLYIFGDNIESELGHTRYLLFYVGGGLAAALIQLLTSLGSTVPTIGASGAIAGVMGAYFILFPRARILTFVPIIFFFTLMEIPAYVFLGFWFLLQFFSGTFSLLGDARHYAGIAWWAHIGGFVGGILLLRPLRPRRRSRSLDRYF
jgi:membrane associated rhomboid family serine protease